MKVKVARSVRWKYRWHHSSGACDHLELQHVCKRIPQCHNVVMPASPHTAVRRWHPWACAAPSANTSVGIHYATSPGSTPQPLEAFIRQGTFAQANPITAGPAGQPALFQHRKQLHLFFQQPPDCIGVAAQLNSSGWKVLGQALCRSGISHPSLVTHEGQPYMLVVVQGQLQLFSAEDWPLSWSMASSQLPTSSIASASMFAADVFFWLLTSPSASLQGPKIAVYQSEQPQGPWAEQSCHRPSPACPAGIAGMIRQACACYTSCTCPCSTHFAADASVTPTQDAMLCSFCSMTIVNQRLVNMHA